jgi:hypothetical protein
MDRYMIFLFFVLVLISLFSAANLITVIELRKQINLTLADINNAAVISHPSTVEAIVPTETISAPPTTVHQVYSNVASEPFFSSYYIDSSVTDLRLDGKVTSLSFYPIYDLILEKDCSGPLCGLRDKGDPSCMPHGCLTESDGQIYYNSQKIDLPGELQGKQIVNITFSPLDTKWVIGIVVSVNGEEEGFAYLFDGTKLTLLINEGTQPKIMTKLGYSGGQITAGGGDNQFIVLYSGYQGIGYLYNNGSWQDLQTYFSLRVQNGGFKAKIIRGSAGKQAAWYVCSEDLAKPKLIKLWQNGTDNIQGAIDLSSIVEGGPAICTPKSDREISIARNLSGSDNLYTFKDRGFDNSKTYHYQSSNLYNYQNKKILSVNIDTYTINALPDSYYLMISEDKLDWQKFNGQDVFLKDAGLDTFYVKADFKPGNAEYSPWFGGMDSISYRAEDR